VEEAVIATPLGFSEYIENGKDGIIIPAKDEKALKNAIVDLMTMKIRERCFEENARKKAIKYSWDKIAKKYLLYLRRLLINEKDY
jgi:glycosyltransferase involved in cell wall biosynthesis